MAQPIKLLNNLEDDVQRFAAQYGHSLEAVERLHETALDFLRSPMKRKGAEDNTIYLLAAACLREFSEIMLLAVHMYGTGAIKLVRALYERVVTLSYLAEHPDEIQKFIDYSDIHWNKLLTEARQVFGDEVIPNIVSKEAAAAIEANYKKNKQNFQQTDCKTCDTKRLQSSWTKKSTPDLAGEVSKELRSLYFKAFQSPTFHIHTTFWGIVDQLKPTPEGTVSFNQKHEEESARDAMDVAHTLMLQVLGVVNGHFNLGKDEVLKQRAEEWKDAWRETAPEGYLPKR